MCYIQSCGVYSTPQSIAQSCQWSITEAANIMSSSGYSHNHSYSLSQSASVADSASFHTVDVPVVNGVFFTVTCKITNA